MRDRIRIASRTAFTVFSLIAVSQCVQAQVAPETSRLPTLQRLDRAYLKRLHEEVGELALKRTAVSLRTGFSDYRCVIHAHSYLSHDSRGTIDEIVSAAKLAHIDAIFMTNHPKKDEDVVTAGQTASIDGILFASGAEANGFLAFPGDGKLPPLNVTEQAFVDSIRASGGQVFIAHPEEHTDWSLKSLTGTEIYNTHADFEDETELIAALRPKDSKGYARLLQLLDGFRDYPQESFSALFDAPTANLRRYDALCTEHVYAATAGNDSHQNTGFVLRGAADGKIDVEDALGEKIGVLDTLKSPLLVTLFGKPEPGKEMMRRILDPYPVSFHYVSTHVLARVKTLPALQSALSAGRAYVAFDWIADPTGTAFIATAGSKRWNIGDALTIRPGLEIKAEVPMPATLKLICNGVCVATTIGRTLSAPVTQQGVYRLEVSVPLGVEQRPWIYTGAILVGAR